MQDCRVPDGRSYEPSHPLAKLAKATVEACVTGGELLYAPLATPEVEGRAGAFVSIHLDDGALRGCIGTFLPTQDNVALEVVSNAVNAATRDPRFWPIAREELPHLRYSVDVLTPPEPVTDATRLDPKRYGVIVEDGHRRGLLLPDIPGVETVEDQLAICRQKAGIAAEEPVQIYRFTVRRLT